MTGQKNKNREQPTGTATSMKSENQATAPNDSLEDEERSYLDRLTDEVRATFGDSKAAQRREQDVERLRRGKGTYKGTYDQASMRGFEFGMPENDDDQQR